MPVVDMSNKDCNDECRIFLDVISHNLNDFSFPFLELHRLYHLANEFIAIETTFFCGL